MPQDHELVLKLIPMMVLAGVLVRRFWNQTMNTIISIIFEDLIWFLKSDLLLVFCIGDRICFLGYYVRGNGLLMWTRFKAFPWQLLQLQIFPLNVKGAAGSLAIWANWFGSWAVSYTFNYLISWSSSGNNMHTNI